MVAYTCNPLEKCKVVERETLHYVRTHTQAAFSSPLCYAEVGTCVLSMLTEGVGGGGWVGMLYYPTSVGGVSGASL